MPDIMTQLDRIKELSEILSQMSPDLPNNKFWKLSQKFDDLREIHRLEDEINDKDGE